MMSQVNICRIPGMTFMKRSTLSKILMNQICMRLKVNVRVISNQKNKNLIKMVEMN